MLLLRWMKKKILLLRLICYINFQFLRSLFESFFFPIFHLSSSPCIPFTSPLCSSLLHNFPFLHLFFITFSLFTLFFLFFSLSSSPFFLPFLIPPCPILSSHFLPFQLLHNSNQPQVSHHSQTEWRTSQLRK